MPEQEPDEKDSARPDHEQRSIPAALTAEQRRLLGTPRPVHERTEEEKELADVEEWVAGQNRVASRAASPHAQSASAPDNFETQVPITGGGDRSSRELSMRRVALFFGVIAALFATFYVGKKFDYWRYLWTTRNQPKLGENIPDKYPGVPAAELVEQGLVLEHAGRWSDASELFIAAKHKDLGYRGILYRVGKLAYDKGNFDTADRLLDRALAFGENIDASNYLRGVIATRNRDLPAAERFFQAATTAEPFAADYYYYWAEALRLDNRPQDAAARYAQAANRARDDQDVTVCQFKVRMARLEAGDNTKLKEETQKENSAGPLALDWSLTDAALAIRENRIDDAVRSVTAARDAIHRTENGGGIFLSCIDDTFFQAARRKYPALATACDIETYSR